MRRTSRLLAIVGIVAAAWVGIACAESEPAPTGGQASKGEQALAGAFKWNNGAEGDLTAKFTPTGENTWEVDFHFKFDGEPHVYSGTAEGNLESGKLSGKVKNENKKRSFTFTGRFEEDGEFRGTHAETTDGRAGDTGTLTLRR